MTADEFAQLVQPVVAGLVFRSETDAEWTPIVWPSASLDLSPTEVCQWGDHPVGSVVKRLSLAEFLTPLTTVEAWMDAGERAEVERYQCLEKLFAQHLAETAVFRVGGQVEATVYLLGRAAGGGWAGVRTRQVRT